ncbi:hypothetical protein [Acuticoccus sediminis]|uniref:hypothetical protein n=1 Tax=Acuticoccus sediminis TaxID=2184697 RepID=UPI000DAB93B8|nr:hypothetical protein [Acuticoccus sediminis]
MNSFEPIKQTVATLLEALAIADTYNAPRRFSKILQKLYDEDGGMVVYKSKEGLTFCAQLDDPGHLGDHFQQETVNVIEPGERLLWYSIGIGNPYAPSQAVPTTLSDFAKAFRTRTGGAVLPAEAWEMLECLLEFRPLNSPSVMVLNDTVHVLSRLRIEGEPWIDQAEAEAMAEADRDEWISETDEQTSSR